MGPLADLLVDACFLPQWDPRTFALLVKRSLASCSSTFTLRLYSVTRADFKRL